MNNIPVHILFSVPFILLVTVIAVMAYYVFRLVAERNELRNALKSDRERFELELSYEKRIAAELIESEKSACKTLLEQEREKLTELRNLFSENDEMRKRQSDELKNSFKALSQEVLEQKANKFNELQMETLTPFKNDIARFQEQFIRNIREDGERRVLLEKQIDDLKNINIKISEDANNLTNALKGEVKTQGNWGEMILERILEESGLKEGSEYFTQSNMKNDDGRNIRPDIVVRLPQERCVVIDSKVSLTAYERFVNEDAEQARKNLKKAHIDSIRTHMKGLSEKRYHEYTEGRKLDFTVMFVPIEGALMEALSSDTEIYTDAYAKNIILASPSTLMVILKLIHVLWRTENRDKNIEKIGDEIIKLISKFDSFVKHMDDIGKELDSAKTAYDKALGSLKTGKGNIAGKMNKISQYFTAGRNNKLAVGAQDFNPDDDDES